jgi:tetratricopeptide (TPR) repeat protein
MDDPITLAYTLNRLGNWHVNIEQPSEVLLYHNEALTLFQRAHDVQGIAQTYDLLGMANTLGGDLQQASAFFQQAITLFRKLDDRQGLASSLTTLMILGEGGGYETGTMVPATTSFTETIQFGELALQTAREIGQRSAEAFALFAIAQYLGPHGEYSRVLEAAQASLAIAKQIEHRQWLTSAHWLLGVLYLDLLALPDAQQHLEQALTLAHELGSRIWTRITAGFLASLYLLQEDPIKAESILASAIEADTAMQTIGQRLVWAARAEIALARGDHTQALDITDKLIASATNLSEEVVVPLLWKLRGEALAGLGSPEEAATMLQVAQKAARTQGLQSLLWRICVSLGKLYQSQRRHKKAEQAIVTARTIIEELAITIADEALRDNFMHQATRMLSCTPSNSSSQATKQAFGGLST